MISAVGKITIPLRPFFAGTCFAIAPGRVLTNRHVLEEIARHNPSEGWRLKWPMTTTVDFIGEDGKAAKAAFRVTGVVFAGPAPINRQINFENLDMAILTVDAASDGTTQFPEPVTFSANTDFLQRDRQVYVVGFPAEPRVWTKDGEPLAGTETQVVITSLFSGKFGVKRLAPGRVSTAQGSVAGDAKGWIFCHNSSTLAGNSGSTIVSLETGADGCVGLHFGGAARSDNWAHAVERLRGDLEGNSATFIA